ncbi:GRF zinc finger family protein [Mycena kentingensis (nom. inval.)]|nr:GRF zinc finger family protein [Mycena kentingensis (nom. inval.)]
MSTDTETLVVIVQTLLDSQRSTDEILQALADADGDPTAAAQQLANKPPPKKKRRVGLDSWLQKSTNKEPDQSPISFNASGSPACPTPSVSSPKKPTVDLMKVLKQAPSTTKGPTKYSPLLLPTPEMVAKHTPCTLHNSILPPELACRLFYAMVDRAHAWSRNKWWLFDRVVESPHRTSFFARRTNGIDEDESWQSAEVARFWYNGRMSDVPAVFPEEMEEACQIIEQVVNNEMKKRPRFPLEWAGGTDEDPGWRANVAASNCYEGAQESVGFHSDQLTYLGPYTTIASLSLGTSRLFRLREEIPNDERESRSARTFNVPLSHNSLTIMHASCQEKFKHAIPPLNAIDMYRPSHPRSPGTPIEPSNIRINITFRFYRPDFKPESIPRCKCNVPTILRPDMKNRTDGKTDRYWWACYAGAQNDGVGCNFWQRLDMAREGRGPIVGDLEKK